MILPKGNRQPFPRKNVNYKGKNLESLHDIVAGCLRNDQKEQKSFYEKYYGYCLKIVFRYIYRYEVAVDIVNDGFVKVFRNFSRFQCPQPENLEMILMGWIKKIMVNTAIDHLRRSHFVPEIGSVEDHIWNIEDNSQAADQSLLYKELITEVRKLPPAYRAVFNMFVIDGLSHNEIADILNISVGTSKSNLFKAKAQLQKRIKPQEQKIAICKI